MTDVTSFITCGFYIDLQLSPSRNHLQRSPRRAPSLWECDTTLPSVQVTQGRDLTSQLHLDPERSLDIMIRDKSGQVGPLARERVFEKGARQGASGIIPHPW